MTYKPYLPKAVNQYGAQMGRKDILPEDKMINCLVHLTRIKFVDYCYDQGGAYWGLPHNLYLCENLDHDIYTFFRADNRDKAKTFVSGILPNVRYYR